MEEPGGRHYIPILNGQGEYGIVETNGMASVLPKVLIIVKGEGYNHHFQ